MHKFAPCSKAGKAKSTQKAEKTGWMLIEKNWNSQIRKVTIASPFSIFGREYDKRKIFPCNPQGITAVIIF